MWNAASTVSLRRTFVRLAHVAIILAVILVPATSAKQPSNETVRVSPDADARVR